MSVSRRLLDDVAKVATGAAGVAQAAGREAEMLLRHRLERVLDQMELVSREEFDAVKAMAAEARAENERLAGRLAALEAAAAPPRAPARPRAARKRPD